MLERHTWEPLYQLPFSNRAVLDNDQTTLQARLVSLTLSEEISKIIICGGNVTAKVSSHILKVVSALQENEDPCKV